MKVAEGLVAIMVDCSDRSAYPDLKRKYGVSGFPGIFFTDPDGKVVGKLGDRSAEGVKKQLTALIDKHSRFVPWAESFEKGLAKAKEGGKPVLMFFTDKKKDSAALEGLFIDGSLKETLGKFVMVRHEIEKGCATCDRYKVRRGPNVLVLDPNAEDPASKPVSKFGKKKSAKDLKKALDHALKRWSKAKKD
ncbi:MAG: hypothetical protein ACYS99_04705 [Planctomycetota bacterium]